MASRDQRSDTDGFIPRPICQPHAQRNAGAIAEVLKQHLPDTGTLLEIASGTGQHAVTFGALFPKLTWLTSDPWATSRESINGWIIKTGLANVRAPLDIDVTDPEWEAALARPLSGIFASNLLHITAWGVCLGLLRGAGVLLGPDAPLCIYGCFKRDGEHLSQSNIDFDRHLRSENPEWGVRDLEAVEQAARDQELRLVDIVDMPRDNFTAVFRRGLDG